MQCELIQIGLLLTIQQLCKGVNLGSIHDYGDLFFMGFMYYTMEKQVTNKNSLSKVCHEWEKIDE